MSADIQFRTSIAAVNDGDNIRVYFQDPHGYIRQTAHSGSWSGGQKGDRVVDTVRNSPLAAAATKGLKNIDVYYLDAFDVIHSRYYSSSSGGWGPTTIGTQALKTAPYSQLEAVWMPKEDEQRLYYQKDDDTIQEWIWKSGAGWSQGDNLGKALAGTAIGATAYTGSTGTGVRLFVQHDNNDIVQKCWNEGKGWWDMNQVISRNASFRSSIAATNVNNDGPSDKVRLRVYLAGKDNKLWQWCWDSAASGGYRNIRGLNGQVLAPGTQLAAISWDSNTNLRVYYQADKALAGITEWKYDGTASDGSTGQDPLPPL